MNKIKFSHFYWKFPVDVTKKPVKLISAIGIHSDDLSEAMITYDATYTKDNHVREYKIPEGDLILLIFQIRPNCIFTTIRRFTPSKWRYYKGLEGEMFDVVIESD